MSEIVPQDIPQKQCPRCKLFYPATLEFFNKDKYKRDGLFSRCKQCTRKPPIKSEIPEGYKICSKCNQLKPATTEYFSINRVMKDNFEAHCKACRHAAYRAKHPPKETPPEGHKRCSKCKEIFPATVEYFVPRKDGGAFLSSQCRTCRNIRRKEIRQINPRHYDKEREHLRYLAHRERGLEYRYKYAREHKEEYRVYYALYQQTHKEQRRTYGRNRRARKKASIGYHTLVDIQHQYEKQKGKCYYCQKKVKWGEHHVDHVVPLSRGGSNDPSNLVITCPPCNLSKKDKLPHEWSKGGRLL